MKGTGTTRATSIPTNHRVEKDKRLAKEAKRKVYEKNVRSLTAPNYHKKAVVQLSSTMTAEITRTSPKYGRGGLYHVVIKRGSKETSTAIYRWGGTSSKYKVPYDAWKDIKAMLKKKVKTIHK